MSPDEARQVTLASTDSHTYTYEQWKADGHTASYSATCSCGWVSEPGLLGYGRPATGVVLWKEHADACKGNLTEDDDYQECERCHDSVYTLSTDGLCDGCCEYNEQRVVL